jgi:hypothetical protein
VQAVNSAGAVSNWSTISATTSGGLPPSGGVSTPTNLRTETVSSTHINLYWDSSPPSENVIGYNVRLNGTVVLRKFPYASFPFTGLHPGTGYNFEVQAVNSAGAESNWSAVKSGTTSSNAIKQTSSAESIQNETSVGFIGYDLTSQGNWVNHYGKQGSIVVGNKPNLPEWLQLSIAGQGFHQWAPSTTDNRSLLRTENYNERVAATLFSPTQFEMNFNFIDGQPHRLSLYAVDWEGNNRSQTFEIVNPLTGQVLDTRTINNFNGGIYVVWQVKGKFIVRIRNNGNSNLNAVVSGVFIDSP